MKMDRIFAVLDAVNSAMDAGLKELAASSIMAFQSESRAILFFFSIIAGAFAAGGGTVAYISVQRDVPVRLAAVEEELMQKRERDADLFKMVCEIRATLNGANPLSCWRVDVDSQTGGR
jgi:hypothetical protein